MTGRSGVHTHSVAWRATAWRATGTRTAVARGLLLCLALIATRPWLEQTMWLHMLVQMPLLIAAGSLFATAVRPRVTRQPTRLAAYNAAGVPGLLLASAAIAVWMIPRALDAAAESWPVDSAKFAMLMLAGLMGAASWRQAGTVVRLFVLGNGVWMTATVGVLLLDAPNRVCVSYGTNDQELAGYGLVLVSLFVVVAALVRSSSSPGEHAREHAREHAPEQAGEHARTPTAT